MDRRNPQRQAAKVDGQRATDPTLSTRECAKKIGLDTEYIVGEIRDGRLKAFVISRPGRRPIYRVTPADFDAYLARYGSWTKTKTPANR
jgi:hypothetical protein